MLGKNDGRIAVIGGGIFGCTAALSLSYAGFEVVIIERLSDIILGVTKNTINRVHLGYHYPRDKETAKACRDSFKIFVNFFPQAVQRNIPNAYCIATEESLTTVEEYSRFCDEMGLPYSELDLSSYKPTIRGCDFGLLCDEGICDSSILRELLLSKIQKRKNIKIAFNTDALKVKRVNPGYEITTQTNQKLRFDGIVNCTYSDTNRLTNQLGYNVVERQFEYTVVPVVKIDLPPQSITIMDGQFMTLFPHGATGNFTLYHVKNSILETHVTTVMNRDWLDPDKSPFAALDKRTFFENMREACSIYVPKIGEAELLGFLKGPRMVLANHEEDDARPSIVQNYGDGYLTVFSGKIDNCFAIADSICESLGASKLKRNFIKLGMHLSNTYQTGKRRLTRSTKE